VGWGAVLTRLDPRFHQALISYSKLAIVNGRPLKEMLLAMFSGGTPDTQNPAYWKGSIPWVSPKDFGEYELASATDNITEAAIEESSSKIAPANSVLLVVRSGVLVHTIPIGVATTGLAINQDVKAMICRSDILPHYLAAYFRVFQKHLLPVITKYGATVQSINTAELKNLVIPVPPLEIQTKIVAIYKNALLANKNKRRESARLLSGIDDYLLTELGITLPPEPENTLASRIFTTQRQELAGWRFDPNFHKPWYQQINGALATCAYPSVRIGELCYSPVGGATPTRGDSDLYAEDGIKFLRIMNIGRDALVLDDVKFISPSVHDGDLYRSNLLENDVLMTITGRVGTAAVVTSSVLPANINQHIVRLRLRDQNCHPEFLSAYLNCTLGHALSNRGVSGGTRIALDYPAIRSLQIPLPPLEVQKHILRNVLAVRQDAKQLRQQAESELDQAKRQIETLLLGGQP